MTNEEMDRKMEFILKQQESFSDNLQQVSDNLQRVSDKLRDVAERQDKLQERQDQSQAQIELLTKGVVGLVSITGNLTKTVEDLAEAQKHTEARVNDLAASVKDVTERLDIFINVVERYITENRNGKKSKSASPRPKRNRPGGQGRRKQS